MNRVKISNYLLLIILLLGAFLRFYKLDWGSGYFFHPDEYHIAAAVERLSFPSQMNPQLFSYGSFTVYLIYFTQKILYFLSSHLSFTSTFASAILIGRFYSALFSTLTVLLIYFIAKKLFVSLYLCIFVSLLAATLPGSIQQAHFTTPESILTFWLMLTLLMSINYLTKKENKYLYLAAASQGLALGTKIVAITFLPVLLLTSAFAVRPPRISLIGLIGLIRKIFVVLSITLFFFLLSFPYAFLDWQGFRGSLNYETSVARGEPVVFYTRQFINTVPILFQFQKIFPYALGPGVLIFGSLGLLCHLSNLGHLRNKKWLAIGSFLAYFLPNAFLFAKWTRFMVPIFPFFASSTGYLLSLIKKKKLLRVACCVFLVANLIWTTMFFSIYLKPDIRLTATNWLNRNLPSNSFILTESGNMLEVPLEGNLKKTPFDFYHLEENKELQDQLPELLNQSDYFIVQSRRIFANYQRLPDQFPKTARFYDLLFSNQLGFAEIKDFSSFPTLRVRNLNLEINDELAEETWSVFDHPVIRVYKKVKPLTTQDYEKLLKI